MLHLLEVDLRVQLVHYQVQRIEVLVRHCQPHLVQSILLPAHCQQLLEVLVGNKVFEVDDLPFLNKFVQCLIVLYDFGENLFDQVVIL